MRLRAELVKIVIGVSMAAALAGCSYEPVPLTCDREDVTELLAGLFNKSELSMLSGVTATNVSSVENISGMGDTLSCRGALTLSNDKSLDVAYTVAPTSDGDYWLEYIPISK